MSMVDAVLLALGWFFIQDTQYKKGPESYWNSAESIFIICRSTYRWRIAHYVADVTWVLLLLFWLYNRFFAEVSVNYFFQNGMYNFILLIWIPFSFICVLIFFKKWHSEIQNKEFLVAGDLWKPIRKLFMNSNLVTLIAEQLSRLENVQQDVCTAVFAKNNLREYHGTFVTAVDAALVGYAYGIYGAQVALDVRSSKQKREVLERMIERLRAVKTPLTSYRAAGEVIKKAGEGFSVSKHQIERTVEGKSLA